MFCDGVCCMMMAMNVRSFIIGTSLVLGLLTSTVVNPHMVLAKEDVNQPTAGMVKNRYHQTQPRTLSTDVWDAGSVTAHEFRL